MRLRTDLVAAAVACVAVSSAVPVARADVKLAAIFGDHMVLQQGQTLPVWGTASPGEKVVVKLLDQTAHATADAGGKWRVDLKSVNQPSDRPVAFSVSGKNTIKLSDVLIGQVWLCSGQSNMGFTLGSAWEGHKTAVETTSKTLRLFQVDWVASPTLLDDVRGHWVVTNEQDANAFSAVAFFFGKELNDTLQTPVGLIHSSWGGTPAEAWTDPAAMQADPVLKPMIQRFEDSMKHYPRELAAYKKRYAAWADANYPKMLPNEGADKGWQKPDFDDASWKTYPVPGAWEQTAGVDVDGFVWARRSIDVPAMWAGKDLALDLGIIDDNDITYFNGQSVGETGPHVPRPYQQARSYTVPGRLVKAGRNTIAVRVLDILGPGGLMGPAEQMKIDLSEHAQSNPISLAGDWKLAVERTIPAADNLPPGPDEPMSPDNPNAPSTLWNGMLRPLAPFAIKGAIWYQGESNAGRAVQYQTLLPAMIKSWRKAFEEPNFPFLIVELANFTTPQTDPGEAKDWPELREAQQRTAKNLPDTYIATAIDVGDANDIHPKDKQTVGHRLALVARKNVYGQDVIADGPTLTGMKVNGSTVVLGFAHADGLVAKDNAPTGFAVAGKDKVWHWATAKIDGTSVAVTSPDVKAPLAVRYGWGMNPPVSLYNNAGLPALPFRTDDWPLVTADRR